jgi:hypothetical protein
MPSSGNSARDLRDEVAAGKSVTQMGPDASPAQAYAARLSWMRVIRSVIDMLEIDPQATPEIKERLLAPLHRAEAMADRRRRGGVKDGDGDGGDLEDPDDVPEIPELPVPNDGLVTAPAPVDSAD